jgi:hypothetical protein
MGKNHFWLSQDYEGDLIEIKVLNGSESTIEKWKFNINDNKTASKVLKILRNKYGFNPNLKEGLLDKERDLKWLQDRNNEFPN